MIEGKHNSPRTMQPLLILQLTGMMQIQLGQQHGRILYCSGFHGQARGSRKQELHGPPKHQGLLTHLT